MKGPALSKTAAFCMLLLIASLRVVDAARDRLKVPSGYGFDFFLDRFDNGRSNPYRVTFYNSGFKSVYKFNQDGFVKNIEADQETYRITYTENGILETVTGSSTRRNLDERGLEENADMPTSILKSAASADDESLTTTPTHYGDHVEVDSSRAQQKLPCGLHEGSAGMATYLRNTPSLATRRLYACEDCDMTWDTVCTKGVETVCNLEGYGSPFLSAGVASIDVLFNILGGICSELSGSDVCDGECAAECYPPLRITLEWTGDEGLSGGQVPSLDLYVMEPGGMTASSTNSETVRTNRSRPTNASYGRDMYTNYVSQAPPRRKASWATLKRRLS